MLQMPKYFKRPAVLVTKSPFPTLPIRKVRFQSDFANRKDLDKMVTKQEFLEFQTEVNKRIASQSFIEDRIFNLAAINRLQILLVGGASFIFISWLALESFNHRVEINHLFRLLMEGDRKRKDADGNQDEDPQLDPNIPQ
jgi:hypothetical protein